MGRQERKKKSYPVVSSKKPADRCFSRYMIAFIALLVLVPLVQARTPDWTYSSPDSDIGGVAVSSKGDLVAAAAEKVLFFTQSGTLLDKQPYGTDVMMTADGNYTASVYFSTFYFFKNPLTSGSGDHLKATKLWDHELNEQVTSFGISRDGSTIAGQTIGKSFFIINTRNGSTKGNNEKLDSIIKITPDGRRILGVSQSAVHSYSMTGNLTHTADLTTFSAPHIFLLSSNGVYAVFNDGQTVRSINTYNGTERWKQQIAGYITTLLMNPAGSMIVAGTETGNIAALNSKGNLSWTYAANPEKRQASGITCTALSDNGTMIVTGTADGRVLFLNAKGELTDSYTGKEYIRHIAVSADGSTVVAASTNTLSAFVSDSSSRSQPVTTISPSSTIIAVHSVLTTAGTQVPMSTAIPKGTSPSTITEIPTTYSVIRSATQSSSSLITLVSALLLGKKIK